jgi:hypothetical protein
MGNRPVRSAAVHWSRYTVNASVAPAGVGEARRTEARETPEAEREAEETGEKDEHKETAAGESLGRVEAMPRRRVLRWPNEVERERGGNLRTRAAVSRGILRMKPRVKARMKVDREGDPNARCQ